MACIYLIRHGQASFGQENYDQLSDLGFSQASRLGQILQERLHDFSAVFSGTMLRHKQTAESCLASMNSSISNIEVSAGWNEFDHQEILAAVNAQFATASGVLDYIKTHTEPAKALKAVYSQAMVRWMSEKHKHDYSESFDDFKSRVLSTYVDCIGSVSPHNNVAIFTSGGPISVVSQHLLGIDDVHLGKLNWSLLNCGVTKIVKTKNMTVLSSLNEHSHFEGPFSDMLTYK